MTQLGKRYECAVCSTVVLCLVPSDEEVACCGQAMGEKDMEQLPSGD